MDPHDIHQQRQFFQIIDFSFKQLTFFCFQYNSVRTQSLQNCSDFFYVFIEAFAEDNYVIQLGNANVVP